MVVGRPRLEKLYREDWLPVKVPNRGDIMD